MIYINNIEVMRGTNVLLSEASATIFPQKRVGLVGKNGCGKSTLFAILKNKLSLEQGSVTIPKNWLISSIEQETPGLEQTALDYIIDGDTRYRDLCKQLEDAEHSNDGNLLASIHEQLEHAGAYTIKSRAEALLFGLGFSKEEINQPTKNFSGGWRMRLNLAKALICPSDLLLLDEPTNHLDLDTVIWLEGWLKRYTGTLIIISHDRDFLDNICTHIIQIENKKLNSYTGNYSSFEKERAQRMALEQALFEKQQNQLNHMRAFVERFRYKASKAKQAQSRLKAMEKMEQIVLAQVDSPFSFKFFDNEELPTHLVNMSDLNAGYGDHVVLNSIKLNLVAGARIGLLGKNGAGKSTFIKTLAGEIPPINGNITFAKGIKIGYFAQHQLEYLVLTDSPLQHLQRLSPDVKEQELRSFLGGFGFSGNKALEEIKHFSGGEKARLVLALIVWQKPNLLLLDEPTNHLDIQMREAIVVALSSFKGTLIVVSHDRHLLRTTTDEFYIVANSSVSQFNGDLDDYNKYLEEQAKLEQETKKAENKAIIGTSAESNSKNNNGSYKSKEQKRLESEFRQSIKPLKDKITKAEKKMEELTARKKEIEELLADGSIYDAENKDKLNSLTIELHSINGNLEEIEIEWLENSDELQTLVDEFNRQNN